MFPFAALFGSITNIVSRLIPDPDKQSEIMLQIKELEMRPEFAQIEVNEQEAANPNLFVSGWRPACGWIGVIGLGCAYIITPLLSMFVPEAHLPHFPLDTMMNLVYAMLGLGTMRTVEKLKGKA